MKYPKDQIAIDMKFRRKELIDDIVGFVCNKYSVKPHQLRQKTRVMSIVKPRWIAMVMMYELTYLSLPEVGVVFNKHHTSVLSGYRKLKDNQEYLEVKEEFINEYSTIYQNSL